MTGKRDERIPIDPEGLAKFVEDIAGKPLLAVQRSLLDALAAKTPITTTLRPRPLGRDGDQPPKPKPFLRGALDEIMGRKGDTAIIDEIVNRGFRREPDGQSALPRFNRYSIPIKARPGEIECPYCVKRPIGAKGLRDHCRAQHPDKPEAR